MSNERTVLLPLLLCLGVAAWVAADRIGVERDNSSVALVADHQDVAALAAYTGLELTDCLARLHAAGLTSVAVEEPSLLDLRDSGELRVGPVASGAGCRLVASTRRGGVALAQLALCLPAAPRSAGAMVAGSWLETEADWRVLAELGGGLDPRACDDVTTTGLRLVARLRNAPGYGPAQLDRVLERAADYGATMVIFSGDQVLGYRELTSAVAAALSDRPMLWGRVEFASQKGETDLANKLLAGSPPVSYVRVHSITEAEMAKTAVPLAIERYRRAARERNIRALYVRLAMLPSVDLLESNLHYVRSIAAAVRGAGLTIGAPAPWRWSGPAPAARWVLAVCGVAPIAAWLLVVFTGPWRPRSWLFWWAVIGLGLLALLVVSPGQGAKLAALLGGIALPTAGGRWALLRQQTAAGQPPWRVGLVVLWGAAAWAVAGGLLTVGLLSQSRFLLHHDGFAGVKLSQLGPLFAVAAMVILGVGLPGVDGPTIRDRWGNFWREPLRYWHVVIAMAALLALVTLLVRSGNEGVGVTDTELRLRALLENLLGARPRTKEMLCHPAMFLAGLAAARGRKDLSGWLTIIGMVGVVSTFNTFCHTHTPLTQSLLRTFHALWIGSLLGLVAAPLVRRPEPADG